MLLIKSAIDNLSFDAKIRAESAMSALNHVDLMIENFKIRKTTDKGGILLDVFGLLQGLFVGIDALYQLSISTTKYKYHININTNKNLRALKFLRNDVVGHPTNRNYEDGSFGFSIILNDQITRDQLSYETYIIKGKKISKNKQSIHFDSILKAYEVEKRKVINDLKSYLGRQPRKLETTGILVTMYEKGSNGTFDLSDLDLIEKKFMAEQNLKKDSGNRFLWRLNLLKKLYVWQDAAYQDVLNYMTLKQIISMYQMNQDLNDKKIRVPSIKLPELLETFKQFVSKSKEAEILLTHLNEKDHPLFVHDIDHLIALSENEALIGLLQWFKKISDSDHSFLVGKLLKDILS